MPRFARGRMFNRRSGTYAPRLYSGNRPRRASHRRFQTQVSPYGAGGGGRSQMHAGHAGHAGNVYGAMLAQAQSGRGTNMGIRASANVNRSSRQLGHYRRGLSGAGKDAFSNFMGGRKRSDFGSRGEYRAARRQAKRERSQARRQYAGSYRNPFTGTSHRRVTTLSRHGGDYGNFRRATRFTTPFSSGSRSRMKRHTTRHQGATNRYRYGQKNPKMRNINMGGYRYMSPQFHTRLGQARRGQQTVQGFGNMINNLSNTAASLGDMYNRGQQFRRNQNRNQIMDQSQFGQIPGGFGQQSSIFNPTARRPF